MSVLIFSPHVDDAELSLGGYINQLCRKKRKVVVVNLSCSEYKSDVHSGAKVGVNQRIEEGLKASRRLGMNPDNYYIQTNLVKENKFNEADMGQFVNGVQSIIQCEKPDRVFIPLPTFNQDHKVTYDVCMAALRPHSSLFMPSQVFGYEQPTQYWGGDINSYACMFFELDDHNIQAKLEALKCHESQAVSKEDGPFGLNAVKSLARLRGSQMGKKYAEMVYHLRSFETIR